MTTRPQTPIRKYIPQLKIADMVSLAGMGLLGPGITALYLLIGHYVAIV